MSFVSFDWEQAALGRLEDTSPETDTANPPRLFPGKRKNL